MGKLLDQLLSNVESAKQENDKQIKERAELIKQVDQLSKEILVDLKTDKSTKQ